ncbi:MAG: hypothetical protein KF865_06040 [Bdellovibrionaceae bacterium]|nr:hypothetical protein [Pseudobdellovibrionaceae bacterium]
MRKFLLSFLILAPLSGCSLYKSNVRRDFESQAPEYIKTTALGECQVLGALPAWLEREFSGGGAELLIADNDLEVWKKTRHDGRVILQSFRPAETGTESCRREFADEDAWSREQAAYFGLLDRSLRL